MARKAREPSPRFQEQRWKPYRLKRVDGPPEQERGDGRLTPRIYRSQREIEAVRDGKVVESVNTLHCPSFFHEYGPRLDCLKEQLAARLPSGIDVAVIEGDALFLRGDPLDDCLQLIEETSAEDYHRSEMKWVPAKKRNEMMLPDLRYILFYEEASGEASNGIPYQALRGFVSFMITYEDGHEVIYVYEIHLKPEWQGKGIGGLLMEAIEHIGQKVGVQKSMLTVFKSNELAIRFYNKLGYVEDEFSPRPRKLRNGTVKESSYVILSKNSRR